jgi:subtilisin family serine protease
MAPGVTVTEARMTEANGVATDVSAARRMATTLRKFNLAGNWPDLIVNAFGSPACDVDPLSPGGELVPVGLQAVAEAVDRIGQSMIVASAGNRATNRRFYPAAFPGVLAVGALDATLDSDGNAFTSTSRSAPAASFSNFGHWVDAWAPGVDLVTTHVNGFRFEAGGDLITGIASVSGTSFAGPYVASLLAEQMAATGQTASAAWAAIKAVSPRCSTTLGSGYAVALPRMTATATTPPDPGSTTAC